MKSSKPPRILCFYAVLICAWYLSWLTIGDANWSLIGVNRVVPYLFVPVPLLFIWVLRLRGYGLLLLLLLPVSIFLKLYSPYLYPKFAPPINGRVDLTVMTYNVLYSNPNHEAVANVLLTYHPDLVALQEVQPAMMKALVERLSAEYPYSLMGTSHDFGTTAVFSRYPLQDAYILDLGADRPAVIVKTEVNHQLITFVAVHLMAYGLQWVGPQNIPKAVVEKTSIQNVQAKTLLRGLEKVEGLIIVACDCNSKETSSSYRILDRSMDSAASEVGWLLAPTELPGVNQDLNLQHIDYVFYRGSLEPLRAYTIENSGGSDHQPVLALFSVR